MTTIFILCAIVTAISAFVSLGFGIAFLQSKGEAWEYAYYFFSRALAMAVLSLVPLFTGSVVWLYAIATGMIIIQVADIYVGIKQRSFRKTGPIVIAVLNLVVKLPF